MPEAGADSLLIYGLTAMVGHLLMSLGQTLFHHYLGHSRLGGRFFKNHIQFHHVHYAGDHVVSTHYLTVILRALLSRQPISCCRIMAWPLFLVQLGLLRLERLPLAAASCALR